MYLTHQIYVCIYAYMWNWSNWKTSNHVFLYRVWSTGCSSTRKTMTSFAQIYSQTLIRNTSPCLLANFVSVELNVGPCHLRFSPPLLNTVFPAAALTFPFHSSVGHADLRLLLWLIHRAHCMLACRCNDELINNHFMITWLLNIKSCNPDCMFMMKGCFTCGAVNGTVQPHCLPSFHSIWRKHHAVISHSVNSYLKKQLIQSLDLTDVTVRDQIFIYEGILCESADCCT